MKAEISLERIIEGTLWLKKATFGDAAKRILELE